MLSTGGSFFDVDVEEGDVYGEPLTDFDHLVMISGYYAGDSSTFDYTMYLKPWGMDWEDVRAYDEDLLPYFYDSWYAEAMYGVMPDEMPE